MATCVTSYPRAVTALGVCLLGTAFAATTAKSATSTCCAAPPERLADQDTLARLKAARARARETATAKTPRLPPAVSGVQQRRAFEAMRARRAPPGLEVRARDAIARAREAVATEQATVSRRIGKAIGLEMPDLVDAQNKATSLPSKAWVPVVFVSASIPTGTLRNYAAQLERTRGVLAFRGMPGGLAKVAPMAKLSAEILRLDPGCEGPACAMRDVQVIVDPLLFRQHGVSRVPAFAMAPGDPTQPYCERDENSPRASHLVFGDAALSGLLEEYARLGGKEEVRDATALIQAR